jgi:hypothetical protein
VGHPEPAADALALLEFSSGIFVYGKKTGSDISHFHDVF